MNNKSRCFSSGRMQSSCCVMQCIGAAIGMAACLCGCVSVTLMCCAQTTELNIMRSLPDCNPAIFHTKYEPSSSRGSPSLSVWYIGDTLFSQLCGSNMFVQAFWQHVDHSRALVYTATACSCSSNKIDLVLCRRVYTLISRWNILNILCYGQRCHHVICLLKY